MPCWSREFARRGARLRVRFAAGQARVGMVAVAEHGRGVARWLGVVVAVLLCMGPGVGPARAEAAREWERLPDGRVMIESYGRRFAFSPDMPLGFVHGQRPHRTRPGGWEPHQATLQEVIADRAAAEAWWTHGLAIIVPSRLVEPLLFEGPAPVDRNAVRLTPAFEIWVYRDPTRTFCGSVEWEGFRRHCAYFLERSRDEAVIGSDGFVVERPPFLRGTSKTYYVFRSARDVRCQETRQSLHVSNFLGRFSVKAQHLESVEGHF